MNKYCSILVFEKAICFSKLLIFNKLQSIVFVISNQQLIPMILLASTTVLSKNLYHDGLQ